MLDDVLVLDLTSNIVSHRVAQVADGMEGVAFHPSGRFAVISCLNLMPWTASSSIAVISLDEVEPTLLSHVPIEKVPEGIEFSSDGRQLFVGSTLANHISVFYVEGKSLERSPFVLHLGAGHAALGIASQ